MKTSPLYIQPTPLRCVITDKTKFGTEKIDAVITSMETCSGKHGDSFYFTYQPQDNKYGLFGVTHLYASGSLPFGTQAVELL